MGIIKEITCLIILPDRVQHNPKDALPPIHNNITEHQILKKTKIKDRDYTKAHNYLPEPFQKKE